MGIDTTTAAMHPSTNALDNIPDDLLGPIPAEIRLGQTVLMMMDKPPEVRDVITVTMRLRIKDKGEGEAGKNGEELVHYRMCKVVAAWLKGDPEPPDASAAQPALFGDDGEPTDDPEALGDVLDNVSRPSFSNLTGSDDD